MENLMNLDEKSLGYMYLVRDTHTCIAWIQFISVCITIANDNNQFPNSSFLAVC